MRIRRPARDLACLRFELAQLPRQLPDGALALGDTSLRALLARPQLGHLRRQFGELALRRLEEPSERDVERDFIMTAPQAKEYGIIDEIIDRPRNVV